MVEKLYDCLSVLDKTELKLIKLLFFVGYSERELSKITGIPRKTISYQKRRILKKLKKLLN
ncbi:sigma factor-like helix-turn-helix DNA-binding protein [Anaerotignum neopropionicum]|uniref:sigma factor-like helix-turn-helix DNA-binding protein n=1 Tax=Anaerotignum neopropionicum TaxID=36847 RepID=UPI0008241357